MRGRIGIALLAAIMACGLMSCGSSNGGSDSAAATSTQQTTPPTATVARDSAQRAAAASAAKTNDYVKAIALAAAVDAGDLVRRYRRAATQMLERQARHALSSAHYATAIATARKARRLYGTAASAAPDIRFEAEQRLAARRTATRLRRQQLAQREAAPPPPPPSSGDSGGDAGQYAGMTCPEIGHSFSVPPGSDPEHDADNDGTACESQ